MVVFLIIKLDSLGDILFSTPLIRGLKEQVEESEIHFLTLEAFIPVLANNPYVSKIHRFSDNFREMIPNLKNEEIDYVIDLQRNFKSLRIVNALHRITFSFKSQNFREWVYRRFKINKLSSDHLVDKYLATASAFSIENDGKGLDFFIHESDEVNLLEELSASSKKFLAVIVGADHFTRQIPVEKLVVLLRNIQMDIILLGEKEDIAKAVEIETISTSSRISNFAGKLRIGQVASVLKKATVVLSPDTDLMHIASVFGKPLFSVWGSTVPDFGRYPYISSSESAIKQVQGLNCRPCSKRGFPDCPKKHFKCMMDQDYNSMSERINFLLNSKQG